MVILEDGGAAKLGFDAWRFDMDKHRNKSTIVHAIERERYFCWRIPEVIHCSALSFEKDEGTAFVRR